MTDRKWVEEVQQVMQSAIARTCGHFESECGIQVTRADSCAGDVESLALLGMTAIIGVGGRINLLIAFSFEDDLINTLYQRMTEDIEVQPDEVEMYREAAAGELVNTIVGNCTIDLQHLDRQGISMTPPIILDRAKTIRRMKNSMFYTQGLNTIFGRMSISLVGPRELFDTNLDYTYPM
jgi:CheY-specific phosphatase CheX